jgi:uncharacterized protein
VEHNHSAVNSAEFTRLVPPMAPSARPVIESERIESIDVLRGVALLGILVLNIKAFAMPGAAYFNPTAYGDFTGINWWVWYVQFVFGDQKFMAIFSMLFGAGIVLMTERAERRSGQSAGVHYRRMAWLVLFGLVHAHLIWYGDILYTYALCGMAIYLLRKLPPFVLVLLACVFIAAPSLLMIASNFLMQMGSEEALATQQAEMWTPPPEAIQAELDAYRGSWLEQMSHRVPTAIFFETLLQIFFAPHAAGMMCLGIALYRWGVLSAMRSMLFYAIMAITGVTIGATMTAINAHLNMQSWPFPESFFLYSQLGAWGSVPLSLGYVALVMLACKMFNRATTLYPLAAVGRMAFTNYLMQSVLCTLYFYGHGLGCFGKLERIEQMYVVVSVWVIQLIYSPIWLRYFRFGPAEWLWRSLTYWRWQPFVRRSVQMGIKT